MKSSKGVDQRTKLNKSDQPITDRPIKKAGTLTPVSVEGSAGAHEEQYPRHHHKFAAPSWEQESSPAESHSSSSLAWVVFGSLGGLVVVALASWLVLDIVDLEGESKPERRSARAAQAAEAAKESPEKMTAEEQKVQKEIEGVIDAGMVALMEAESVVRSFLTAETVEDLEGLVRTPEVTIPRLREWYQTHVWQPPGAKTIGYGGGVSVKGAMASFSVKLDDYSVKPIAVERTPEGYLVDWESWVAWSEIAWEELFKKRPTQLTEVRVSCEKDSYYNRLFNDDSKWLAVRMESPGKDRSIYGYIDTGTTTLTSLLGDLKSGHSIPVTIKIRYPEGSIADDQVIIEEYIQHGWVRPPKENREPASSDENTPTSHE